MRSVFGETPWNGTFDVLSKMGPATDPGRTESFIHVELIPLLKQKAGGEEHLVPGAPLLSPPEQIVCAQMEPCFAFIGGWWYALFPFFGTLRAGRLQIRVQGKCFAEVRRQKRALALERYDGRMRASRLGVHSLRPPCACS